MDVHVFLRDLRPCPVPSQHICTWMNFSICMDEDIFLRHTSMIHAIFTSRPIHTYGIQGKNGDAQSSILLFKRSISMPFAPDTDPSSCISNELWTSTVRPTCSPNRHPIAECTVFLVLGDWPCASVKFNCAATFTRV